jgi:hypothetical protein
MQYSPRWQFSLLTLFALTAVVAATCAAVTSPPHWISGLALGFLSFAFPVAFVLVIVYGEGYWRAFCIGALVPSLEGWAISGLAVLMVTLESSVNIAAVPPTTTVYSPSPPGVYSAPVGQVSLPPDPTSVTAAGYSDPMAAPAPAPVPTEANRALEPPAAAQDTPGGVTAATFEDPSATAATTAPVYATSTTMPAASASISFGVEYDAIRPLAASFARSFRVGGALYWTFAVALGFFAVGVRWLIERARLRRMGVGQAGYRFRPVVGRPS